jgi:uncharacterized protein
MTPLEVMQSYIGAMRSGDHERGFDHYADDVVGHVPGRSPLAGVRRGRAAVEGYIREAIATAHGEVTVELIDMLAGAEHVALVVRERFVDGDRSLDMRRANLYRVEAGKISEIWIFEHDQYAVDEWFAASSEARPDA